MVYTAKKKKKKAEEMRVFLHQECVIFTKSTLELPDTKSGSHDAHSTPHHQQNYQYVECIKVCNVCPKGMCNMCPKGVCICVL